MTNFSVKKNEYRVFRPGMLLRSASNSFVLLLEPKTASLTGNVQLWCVLCFSSIDKNGISIREIPILLDERASAWIEVTR